MTDTLDFCERRGLEERCCPGIVVQTGRCCIPGDNAQRCRPIGQADLPFRYIRWSKTIDFQEDYHFSLKNISQEEIPYRLRVSATTVQ